MKIANHYIGKSHPAYIIAEIGTNYNGRVDLALKLIDAAVEAGADAAKFQIITADRSYCRSSESFPIFKGIELTKEEWKVIIDHARQCDIDCFATFVNGQDLENFSDIDFPTFKVSSSNLTHFALLKVLAQKKKPILLSTGMSYLSEVVEAVQCLEDQGAKEIVILHCTSLYPTPAKDVNLRVLKTLADQFPQCSIGFSDHTVGSVSSVVAVALGARVVEKHFTLDSRLKGPDHHFSATPSEFREMVFAIREVEKMLGSEKKEPVQEELIIRNKYRRSLVALKKIAVGEILTSAHLGVKRSSVKGLEPKDLEKVLGKKTKKELIADEPITLECIHL